MRKMLRLSDVLKKVGLGKTSWWRLISEERAPEPTYPRQKLPVWFEDEIDTWIRRQEQARSMVFTLDEIIGNDERGVEGILPMGEGTWRRMRKQGAAPQPIGRWTTGQQIWAREDIEHMIEKLVLERDKKAAAKRRLKRREDQIEIPGSQPLPSY